MQFLRWLLFPFSLIYGLVVIFRNWLYDSGILKSSKFDLPVISIGNLAVGGAGKSPMTEYLARLLSIKYKVATLSRGYGRKTKGFLELDLSTTSVQGGDEPVQFKQKLPGITVAVCEDRVYGIERIKKNNDLVIMDDAYQHRAVKPGLSILLFDWSRLFNFQFMLPSGDLREPMAGKKRADVLVVTKTPDHLSEDMILKITQRIKPGKKQELFFSYLDYGDLVPLNEGEQMKVEELSTGWGIVLLTGIANAEPLVKKLEDYTLEIIHMRYPDHHTYTPKNIAKLAKLFNDWNLEKKLVITTEKDFQRLKLPEFKELLGNIPVYYLPVEAKIHEPGRRRFNQIIEDYAAKYLPYN